MTSIPDHRAIQKCCKEHLGESSSHLIVNSASIDAADLEDPASMAFSVICHRIREVGLERILKGHLVQTPA